MRARYFALEEAINLVDMLTLEADFADWYLDVDRHSRSSDAHKSTCRAAEL